MQSITFEANLMFACDLDQPMGYRVRVRGSQFGRLGDRLDLRLRFVPSSRVIISVGEANQTMTPQQLLGLVTCHYNWSTHLLRKTPSGHHLTALITAARIRWDKGANGIDGVATVEELALGSRIESLFPRPLGREDSEEMAWRHRAYRGCREQLERSGIVLPT